MESYDTGWCSRLRHSENCGTTGRGSLAGFEDDRPRRDVQFGVAPLDELELRLCFEPDAVVPVVKPLFAPMARGLVVADAVNALVPHQLFIEVLGGPGQELCAEAGFGQVQVAPIPSMASAGMPTTIASTGG